MFCKSFIITSFAKLIYHLPFTTRTEPSAIKLLISLFVFGGASAFLVCFSHLQNQNAL